MGQDDKKKLQIPILDEDQQPQKAAAPQPPTVASANLSAHMAILSRDSQFSPSSCEVPQTDKYTGDSNDLEAYHRWLEQRVQCSRWAVEAISGQDLSTIPTQKVDSNLAGGWDGKGIDYSAYEPGITLPHEYWHVVQDRAQGGWDQYQSAYDKIVKHYLAQLGDHPDEIWEHNQFEVEAEMVGKWINQKLLEGTKKEELQRAFVVELEPKLIDLWKQEPKDIGVTPAHLAKLPPAP